MDAPEELRRAFHDRLSDLRAALISLATEVVGAVDRANTGFLRSDPTAAADVEASHELIESIYNNVEHLGFEVVALQAPVARDLRFVMSSVRIAHDLERCGGLAATIAAKAGVISDAGLTPGVRLILDDLAAESTNLLERATRAYQVLDPDQAAVVLGRTSITADLHRRLLAELYDLSGIPARDLVELGLLSRFYQRLADHAVRVADRVEFVARG